MSPRDDTTPRDGYHRRRRAIQFRDSHRKPGPLSTPRSKTIVCGTGRSALHISVHLAGPVGGQSARSCCGRRDGAYEPSCRALEIRQGTYGGSAPFGYPEQEKAARDPIHRDQRTRATYQ